MDSITSADAVLMLAVPDLYDTPQVLQQFSVDDIYGFARQRIAETAMGADGYMTGGVVFNAVQQTITLMADSPSSEIFDVWAQNQITQKRVYRANMTALLNSLGKKWTCTRGILVEYDPAPQAQKLLRPRAFIIEWERVSPSRV